MPANKGMEDPVKPHPDHTEFKNRPKNQGIALFPSFPISLPHWLPRYLPQSQHTSHTEGTEQGGYNHKSGHSVHNGSAGLSRGLWPLASTIIRLASKPRNLELPRRESRSEINYLSNIYRTSISSIHRASIEHPSIIQRTSTGESTA